MLDVSLYIQGSKTDMFQDENINITDTIQNIRDISSLFTSFTQDFSLPASKNNNKIFGHWYNKDIDGAFDARFSLPAEIKISGANYKTGSIKLTNVKLENNKAISYAIRFYGDGIDLRDALSDKTLSFLNMEAYNHAYTGAIVRDGLELGLSGGVRHVDADIIYPLIAHTKRYVYDSTASPQFYDTTDGNRLEYNQLKPAIRLIHIIEAIENDFNLTFTRDFFSEDEFNDLYMWLNRAEGVINGEADQWSLIEADDYTYTAANVDNAYYNGSFVGWLSSYGKNMPTYPTGYATAWDVTFDVVTGGSGNYDITILNIANPSTDILYQEFDIAAGSKSIDLEYGFGTVNPIDYNSEKAYQPRIYIQSDSTVTTVDVDMTLVKTTYNVGAAPTVDAGGIYDITQVTAVTEINVSNQMPNQRIMDFLMGIFKMFNLTAYKDDDGDIYVDTLDNFYGLGVDRDITKYVDITTSEIKPSILYDTVEFKYADVDTKLIQKREEILDDRFGDLSYNLGNVFGNSTYTVDVPFSHLMFERLEELGTSGYANMLFGWFVDDGDEPIAPDEPLIFYNNGTQTLADIEWEYDSGAVNTQSYQRAGNSRSTGGVQTINFNAELDEWDRNTFTQSLFANYYENYITSVYGAANRIRTVEAYLPPSFILNYGMNDKIIIHGQSHKINSISIDLIDGKSTLELITESKELVTE